MHGHWSTQRGTREREGGRDWMRGRIRTKKKKEAWGEKENANVDPVREREREREREELKDKSQRKQNVKKGIKYKLFGLQLCYNAIIHLGWHYSIIANFLQW